MQITGGYCWPTPKYQNWCAQHAFFEGKKVEDTSPRKSTPRTLKGVRQQYPPVIGAVEHLYNNSIGQCTETRYMCSAQITPPARKFLDGCQRMGLSVVRPADCIVCAAFCGMMSSATNSMRGIWERRAGGWTVAGSSPIYASMPGP